jgi:VIT1/CCC1 family predicted Fe2+/Mn2+ transporter
VTALARGGTLIAWVAGTSIVFLALLGALAARAGGASILVGAWRVTFWGALAMGITAGIGNLFGATGL